MGEEVRMSDCDGGGGRDDNRVSEWEVGLPTADDLTPLSHPLIPPELASAFSISPEPSRNAMDVNLASQNTLGQLQALSSLNNFNLKSLNQERTMELEENEEDLMKEGSESRKLRRIDSGGAEEEEEEDLSAAKAAVKRPRVVWTAQLHKRFVEVVSHLGIKNAVPKTIMLLMNVEGLTRENVASHLQKYRLYLKRMQGLSNEGPASSDHLFAYSPLPQSPQESGGGGGSLHGNGQHVQMPIPMPYPQQMMHMQMMHMPLIGNPASPGLYQGFESHPYNVVQQRDWYQHFTPNDK